MKDVLVQPVEDMMTGCYMIHHMDRDSFQLVTSLYSCINVTLGGETAVIIGIPQNPLMNKCKTASSV